MEASCEHDNEPSGTIKGEDCVNNKGLSVVGFAPFLFLKLSQRGEIWRRNSYAPY
jgi:hypothetical protein